MAKGKADLLTNVTNFKAAAETYKNIVFKIYYLNSEIEKNISNILIAILEQIQAMELKNSLFTVLRELIVNGIKANSKRIYFEQNGLDIQNTDDYQKAISDFREDLAERAKEYQILSKKNDHYVLVSISYKDNYIHISVVNNSNISQIELQRIQQRIELGAQVEDLSQVVEEIVDFTEGAGLGIPMILLMIRKLGAEAKHFRIVSDQDTTKVQVSIPKQGTSIELGKKIKETIFQEVEHLPSFQENIVELQTMIKNEECTINDIALKVKQDASLVADLLRIANSAGYATFKRINSIDEALKNIGLKGFNNILVAYSTQTIIQKRFKKVYKGVWQHSLRAAFYADKLCSAIGQRNIRETSYLAALLHDLGKMVLLTMHPDTMATLVEQKDKSMSELNTIEELSFGVSHSEIGAAIAEHWNFAPELIEAIRLHHQPLIASEENKNLVYMTYLANALLDIDRGYGDFANIEQFVLDHFQVTEKKLREVNSSIQKAYEDFMAV